MQCKFEASDDPQARLWAKMLKTLTLLGAILACVAGSTNTTDLFHTMLHGDPHRLDTLRAQAVEDQRVGRYSGVIGQQLSHLNESGTASAHPPDANHTSALIDAFMLTPIVPDRARCQVYRHIARHECFRSHENSTQLNSLKTTLKTREKLCEVSWSALSNYTVETHLQTCFQGTGHNETCTGHALACMTALDLAELSSITTAANMFMTPGPTLHKRGDVNDTMDLITKASITVRNGAITTAISEAVSVGFTIAAFIPGVDVVAASWILADVLGAITGSTQFYAWNQLEKAIRTNATDPHGIADKRKIAWTCQLFPYLFKHCYKVD